MTSTWANSVSAHRPSRSVTGSPAGEGSGARTKCSPPARSAVVVRIAARYPASAAAAVAPHCGLSVKSEIFTNHRRPSAPVASQW